MYEHAQNDLDQGDYEHFLLPRSDWRIKQDLRLKRIGTDRLDYIFRFARKYPHYNSQDLPMPLYLRYEKPVEKIVDTYLRML